MPHVISPVPRLDAVGYASGAGPASLLGRSPDPELLADLSAALRASTGLGTTSPLIAELISGAAAAITAAILIDRAQSADLMAEGRAPDTLRNRIHPSLAPTLPTDGQICTLFAVDIVHFTRSGRDDDIRRYMHEKLYEMLQKSFDGSGVPWARCFYEDRGDGALVVIPPEIAAKGVLDPLPQRLRGHIRRHNHFSCEAARIQLRVAAHIGPVEHDGKGFVGCDINLLFRMLEARPLKHAIETSGAELALIISDYVYQNLVCRYPALVSPDAFRAVRFQVKQTRAQAWTCLPGVSP